MLSANFHGQPNTKFEVEELYPDGSAPMLKCQTSSGYSVLTIFFNGGAQVFELIGVLQNFLDNRGLETVTEPYQYPSAIVDDEEIPF